MFAGIEPTLFESKDFKEDSVRELVIVPILNRLGYKPDGDVRVARSKSLKHPFITVGTKNLPVTLVPDYTLYSGDNAIFVLDAKAPSEDVLERKHIEQAYSYASHREIKCREFGLCNGKRLVIFNVDSSAPLLDLRFEEFEEKWETIEKFLSAKFLLKPQLRSYRPDLGSKLMRLGFDRKANMLFLSVRLSLFCKVAEKSFTAASDCVFEDTDHMASFDFHKRLFPEIVSGLPQQLRSQFSSALNRLPYMADAELCIEVDVNVRLGNETQGQDEKFVPLLIHKVLASRFNPESVGARATDRPSNVFRLRDAFVITPPA